MPKVSNKVFLQTLFGEEWEKAHVTSFVDDPSNIVQERRGLCWAGGYAKDKLAGMGSNENQYYTISLFASDEGRSRRAKREFESLISSVDARVYFAPINEYLMEYESVFNNVIDSWMIIKAGDWRWAYEWRQEQERKNNGGLTDAQVRDFVDRFAPTYDACLQNLHDKVESKRLEDSRSAMLIEVNKDRSVKMNNEQVETITEILNKARERGAQEGDTEDLMID